MGNQLEGNVAIVALIISLIALFVTINQLLAQLFSSADGYRRCAESVIDAWHVKRHRVWKWSEFRFETQYVTPQIVLLSPQEVRDYQEDYGEIYMINSPNLGDQACKELETTVHQDYGHCGQRRHDRNRDDIPNARSDGRNSNDVEKAHRRKAEEGLRRRKPRAQQPRIRSESDPLVSWLRLLRELHRLAHGYWPDDCTVCPSSTWDKIDTGVVRSDFDTLHSHSFDEFANTSRTDIAVIYRVWTWDFMPPDMIRPLAEVNIGDIVVLAIRMGMQWRALDPEFGKMQADGNGFSLSATDVKGLGTVLRFTAAGPHERYPRLIPSRAVDKMLCGIVPGDPVLVGQDFQLVSRNGSIQNIAGCDGILSKIGVPEGRRNQIQKHANLEVKNDTITLLLPFLPLEGSTMTSYCFPGWHAVPGIRGVHCFWEGRIALHRALGERTTTWGAGATFIETLSHVLERMDLLEQRHGDDWYSRFAWNSAIRNGQEWKPKLECIQDARRIFDWTTQYLLDHDFADAREDGVTKYMQLVGAHAIMADVAIEEAKSFLQKYSHDRSQQALRTAYNITSNHGYYFVLDLYEIGRHYVKHLHDPEIGIAPYLKNRGLAMTEEEAEAAWWVMQLRGITWNFSTHHPDGIVPRVLGNPVPSSFYGNKTPVWIT